MSERTLIDLNMLGKRAKAASQTLAVTPTTQKNAALHTIADALARHETHILDANAQDLTAAEATGMSDALMDRLRLSKERLAGIAADTRKVAELHDPVGEEFDARTMPNGLNVRKRRTPLGVLGVIYEARPNVTIDIAALALKSGNAALLRGGSETFHSNIALMEAIRTGLEAAGLPMDAMQYIEDTDRAHVLGLLRLDQYVDMIIPRGGAGLHRFCIENATVPVITGGIGVCHIYVDASADLDAAVEVIHNAKVQRPSVCNALDTLLIHPEVAVKLLPLVVSRLKEDGVHFRADARALGVLNGVEGIDPAQPEDWDQEWLSLTLGLKVVDDLDAAIAHIREHSTFHSEGILTSSEANAARFVDEVDSAAVFVNASTRFNDGGQFGLGAEVAVSTQKLHARGPMGLEALTTYKWIAVGDYHIRE